MKVVFDEIDHFHPNFDESVPNLEVKVKHLGGSTLNPERGHAPLAVWIPRRG